MASSNSFTLVVFVVCLSFSSMNNAVLAARNLLQLPTTFPPLPNIPKLPQPTMPNIPNLPQPTLPTTQPSSLPKPTLPPLPSFPTIPSSIPKVSLPPMPSFPSIPYIPSTIPSIPFLSPPPSGN